MRVAFSTLACPDWSIAKAAQFAREHGYAGLELRGYGGGILPPDLPESEVDAIKAAADAAGVAIVGLGASSRLVAVDGDAPLAETRAFLRMARRLGARFVRVYGGPIPEGTSEAEAVARVAERLRALVPDAEATGVDILVETHDDFSRSTRLAAALAPVASPRVGAIWDILHPLRHGEPVEETWARLGRYVRHLHIKDGTPRTGVEWDLVPLGTGQVPVATVLGLLKTAGYDGWLTVEWEWHWHRDLAPAEQALPYERRALATIAEAAGVDLGT